LAKPLRRAASRPGPSLSDTALAGELSALLETALVLRGDTRGYLTDATEARGLRGHSDAIVLPQSADEVARVVSWCYGHDVAIVPRGGGSGFAGGAVPIDGGVVLSLERLIAVRAFNPELWRMHVEAGVCAPGPSSRARDRSELPSRSRSGGAIPDRRQHRNQAGGPHTVKYGTTGPWVTGLEAVVPSGDLITVGGPDSQGRSRLRPKAAPDWI